MSAGAVSMSTGERSWHVFRDPPIVYHRMRRETADCGSGRAPFFDGGLVDSVKSPSRRGGQCFAEGLCLCPHEIGRIGGAGIGFLQSPHKSGLCQAGVDGSIVCRMPEGETQRRFFRVSQWSRWLEKLPAPRQIAMLGIQAEDANVMNKLKGIAKAVFQ